MTTLAYETPVTRIVTELQPGTVKLTREIKQAMRDWLANACYFTGGNYRIKSDRRRFAPWNRAVRAAFASCDQFSSAAHAARAQGLV